MKDNGSLLRQYATHGDEAAFRQVVERHVSLVYSAALRQLNGDGHLAEDVAQTVFIALAQKAGNLPEDVILIGWLYRVTKFAAAKAGRASPAEPLAVLHGLLRWRRLPSASPAESFDRKRQLRPGVVHHDNPIGNSGLWRRGGVSHDARAVGG